MLSLPEGNEYTTFLKDATLNMDRCVIMVKTS